MVYSEETYKADALSSSPTSSHANNTKNDEFIRLRHLKYVI